MVILPYEPTCFFSSKPTATSDIYTRPIHSRVAIESLTP